MVRPGPASVAVNLLWLIPGVVGGSEEYTVGLLEALAEAQPTDLSVTLFAQPDLVASHPQLADSFPVEALPQSVAQKPLRFGAECSWLSFHTRQSQLVHHGGGVAPFSPFAFRPQTRDAQRVLVTIHDLQPLDVPENFSIGQTRWFDLMLPRAARVADRIVTPSAFTADRVTSLLGFPRDQVTVVPPVHQIAAGIPDDVPRSSSEATVEPQMYELPSAPYLLYPAVTHPHKRHVDAVAALAILRQDHPDLTLVFTGSAGAAAEEVDLAVSAHGLDGKVHHLGRVPAPALDRLIKGAAAVVFPSVYEGFGNPVLEAMARRTPVVAASATSLPEVAGGAALLAEPVDPQSLAQCVARLLEDDALAQSLRDRGEARARAFTQMSAAEALLSAYRDALR